MTKSDGATYTGRCQPGEGFTVDDCNTKIVGARYFGDTWLARVPANERDDVVSPRDGEGHGSHTASIAVGNHGVRAVVDDRNFGRTPACRAGRQGGRLQGVLERAWDAAAVEDDGCVRR